MTSELLDDYEEGTWTVGDNDDDGVISSGDGQYTKIGRFVIVQAQVAIGTKFTAHPLFWITIYTKNRIRC